MRCVLTNATLIDCVNPRPIASASVTIEDGRIAEVLDASWSPNTRGAEVIDLGGAYLLPGLWDVHIHPDYLAAPGASAVEQTVVFGHRLMEALTEGGVTCDAREPRISWTSRGSEPSRAGSTSARECSRPATS